MSPVTAVIGLGEVGRPLLEVLAAAGRPAVGVDVDPPTLPERGTVDVMHICIPFEIPDFIGEVARYVELLAPGVTVINSTVAVGTTRAVHERTGAPIAHSPVRGKHTRMTQELTTYVKFVGGIDAETARIAAEHFESLGMQTRALDTPEATELAKLSETTYFGLLIAWAQQMERYCDSAGVAYGDVIPFYDEIGFLPPVRYFPGVIGGHCVMPNIEILDTLEESALLDAVRWSNDRKLERDAVESAASGEPSRSTSA